MTLKRKKCVTFRQPKVCVTARRLSCHLLVANLEFKVTMDKSKKRKVSEENRV